MTNKSTGLGGLEELVEYFPPKGAKAKEIEPRGKTLFKKPKPIDKQLTRKMSTDNQNTFVEKKERRKKRTAESVGALKTSVELSPTTLKIINRIQEQYRLGNKRSLPLWEVLELMAMEFEKGNLRSYQNA